MSAALPLQGLVDQYLDADQPSAMEQAVREILTITAESLGGWSQIVIPHLAARFQVLLDEEPNGSAPDVEDGDLGHLLSRWNALAVSAAVSNRLPDAEAALRALLSILRRAQLRLGRLHKGTPLHELGWLRLRTDPEGASPYILAALIEDTIRDPNGFTTGPAARVALSILGRDQALFDEVREFVSAEIPGPEAVRTLARSDPELLALIKSMNDPPGSELLRISLHFDPAVSDLLRSSLGSSADEKGRLFEFLIAYLMRTLGSFDTRGRVRTLDSENDLILRDASERPSVLGDYILVECKNWEAKVGAPEIKKFAQNVRAASCHSGIIATKAGITGSNDQVTDAHYTIRRHYHRDGVILIVLNAEDVDRLANRQIPLHDLLITKYEEIRFDERQLSS